MNPSNQPPWCVIARRSVLAALAGCVACGPATAAVEMINEAETQMLESYTAPGTVFNPALCDPPRPLTDGGVTCTTLPLGWNKPFERFPVAMRFFEAGERGLKNTRGHNRDLSQPYFFVLDVAHGKVQISPDGEMVHDAVPLDRTFALGPNDTYFFNAIIGRQVPHGVINFDLLLVVPQGAAVHIPYKPASWSPDYHWKACTGENAPRVAAHTTGKIPNSHHYKSAEPCPARYTVNTTEDGRPVTSHVFDAVAWFTGSGSRLRTVQRHFKVSASDPPGHYRLELWFAGKLIARSRFEVRR